MAKVASTVSEVLDEGEVPLSSVKPIEEKGLSNGLGLERLLPAAPKSRKPAVKPKVVVETDDDADESDSTLDTKADDSKDEKPIPAKDPKTGRFLPKAAKPSEPPVEDAKPDDDQDTLKKRLKDTRDWASQVNKKNQELDATLKQLRADFEVQKKKLDGTYVEPVKPEVDPVEMAKLNERAKISRAIAEQIYGADMVQELIYAEDSPYRQLEQADPIVKARVFQADQPVMEAIKQLKWKHFMDQYGNDPDEIVSKISEEVKAELVETFKQKGRSKRTIEDVGGLHDVGGFGDESHVDGKTKVPDRVDLKTVFPGFPTGSF